MPRRNSSTTHHSRFSVAGLPASAACQPSNAARSRRSISACESRSATESISFRSSLRNGPSSARGICWRYETSTAPIGCPCTMICADCAQTESMWSGAWITRSSIMIRASQIAGYCQPEGRMAMMPRQISSIPRSRRDSSSSTR